MIELDKKSDKKQMAKPGQSYGERKCINCGKVFSPKYPSEVCCGEACKLSRKRILDHASQIKRGRIKPDDTDWLNYQYEEMKAQLASLLAKLEEKPKSDCRNKNTGKKAISNIIGVIGGMPEIKGAEAVAASGLKKKAKQPQKR